MMRHFPEVKVGCLRLSPCFGIDSNDNELYESAKEGQTYIAGSVASISS